MRAGTPAQRASSASPAVISYGDASLPCSISTTRDGGTSSGLPAPAATTLAKYARRTNCSRANRSVGASASSALISGGAGGASRKGRTDSGGGPALVSAAPLGTAGTVISYD